MEVNKAAAKATEESLNATEIVPAQKAKEKAVIEAEAIKRKAELEAEAVKAKMLREAEAQAEATRIKLNAEAEGTKNKLMAEAEGKRASLLAEAEAIQQKELAPAMALERMVAAVGGNPDLVVQYKMVDQYKGIAEAQAKVLEHVQLGNVTVYGDKNTGADFAKSFISNFAPALDMINAGVKGQFNELFGKKTEELPASKDSKQSNSTKKNKKDNTKEETFEEVK